MGDLTSKNSEKPNNNAPFVIVIGLIVSIGRIVLGNIGDGIDYDKLILIVMAIVNYVAFGFVLLFLYNGFFQRFKYRLNESGLNTKQKRNSLLVSHMLSSVCLIAYFLIGCLYICKFYNSNYNDAISIFALAVSIAQDGLIEKYDKNFYKFINKLAKIIGRFKK